MLKIANFSKQATVTIGLIIAKKTCADNRYVSLILLETNSMLIGNKAYETMDVTICVHNKLVLGKK